MDNGLFTTAKRADVDISNGVVMKFKGFIIEEIPAPLFQAKRSSMHMLRALVRPLLELRQLELSSQKTSTGLLYRAQAEQGSLSLTTTRKLLLRLL